MWLPLLGLAVLTSCASSPPRQNVATGITIPESWTATNTAPGDIVADWWTDFGPPELQQLIAEAWRQNPALQAVVARLDAAAAEARIAGARRFPTLNLEGDANRQKQNFIGFPLPGSDSDVLVTHSTSYGVSLNTVWELDLWGRVRAGHQARLAELEASQEELRGAYLSLAAQTIKAWLAVSEARSQTELALKTVESFRVNAERIQSRYERGLRSPLDLHLALNNLANAEGLQQQRQEQHDRAVRQLEILVGRYPAGALDALAALPEMPAQVPAGLPSDLLQRRPDLAAAERRFAGSEARIREAKANLYPRISLTASGGTSTAELAELVSSHFTIWTLAANAAQPIFEGGRLRGGVSLAKASSREALADYTQTLLRAFGEVESALAAEYSLREREERIVEAARQARAAETLALDRYNSGLEEIVTVLEAQRRVLTAESQLITVRRLRYDNRVDLHLALGGGFHHDSARGLPKRYAGATIGAAPSTAHIVL